MKKLFNTILFAFAIGLFIIGIHQALTIGLSESYWLFMFSLIALFSHSYRKGLTKERSETSTEKTAKPKEK